MNGSEPRNVNSVKRPSGIRATPAANDTRERTTGTIRPKKLAASPYRAKNVSARSRSAGPIPMYRPQRSKMGRPPHAPIAYAISAPTVAPSVPASTTSQKDHG